MEFADHREYQPGDDLKHVNAAAYARFGRPVVKQYRPERTLTLTVLLDTSESMLTGSPSKLQVAKQVAGGLCCAAMANRDNVRVIALRPPYTYRKFQAGARDRIVEALDWIAKMPTGQNRLTSEERTYAYAERGTGVCIVISDFFDEGDLHGLSVLCSAFPAVVAVHVLAPDDLDPNLPEGRWKLSDRERGDVLEIATDSTIVQHYKNELAAYQTQLSGTVEGRGGKFLTVASSRPVSEILLAVLPAHGVLE